MSDALEKYRDELAAKIASDSPGDAESKRAKQRETALASLANGSTVTAAAKGAGISTETLYTWRNTDPAFASAFEQARKDGSAAHEYEIASLRADLRLKAIRALSKALDGERMERAQLTAAIFVAKAELGMIETSRVENVEIVPILDDIPDDA